MLKKENWTVTWKSAGITAGLFALTTVVCALLQRLGLNEISQLRNETYVPLVYVLCVLLVSLLTDGYLCGTVVSLLSVFAVNYVFTYPYMDFDFSLSGYPLTFLTMLAVSLTVNTLTATLKRQERIRMEAETERMRANLLRAISHDLRTPLTMISGYAEVMRDIPGENTPENVQIVIDEANRLTGIVNDLLDLSKLQAGALTLTVSEFNLTEDIRNTLHRYDKLADFSFPFTYDRTVYVCADQLKISQVLYNLVNNAINYSGGNKTVYIDQTVTESTVRVSIRDTGEGIPADKLQYIWDRYYKVDKEHKRAQVGTGLGLSIVKKILDLHGGRYGVASVEGKGSTFWFELPVLRTESLILPEPPTLPEQKADAERGE